MEFSKKNDGTALRPAPRASPRRQFTAEELARVLNGELHLTSSTPLYVAYSGGMDSHVLLHALARLRESAPWRVNALHIDHGLQAASVEWTRHCAEVCEALRVPFRAERVVVHDIESRGLEDAARTARYAALERALPPGAVLFTAHHQDDQAETLLLQLLRGAGSAGLAAMPRIADFGRGRLARPLLDFERETLAAYARAEKLRWVDDASNRDEAMARNFLRHRVWPVLRDRWPKASERLATAARYQADAAMLADALAEIDLASVVDRNGDIRVTALRSLAAERRANALRYWVRHRGLTTPSERVLRELLARVEHDPRTRHALVRWPGGEVRRYRDRLTTAISPPAVSSKWEMAWDPAAILDLPGGWRLRGVATTGEGLSLAKLAGKRMKVRLREGGERCRVGGHTHTLKKLFQDAGIPPWERGRVPLIYVDDDLAAIGDRWICDTYAASRDEPALMPAIDR